MIEKKLIVVESRLAAHGEYSNKDHLRYLLWCCRYVADKGHDPIASHLICPWFLDDSVATDRARGNDNGWFWLGQPHWFFMDLGESRGMKAAKLRCLNNGFQFKILNLPVEYSAAFRANLYPPHTRGFAVAPEVKP